MKEIVIRINDEPGQGAGIEKTVSIEISGIDRIYAIGILEIAKAYITDKHTKSTFDGFAILETRTFKEK